MASVCPEGGAPDSRKRMIKELITGRDLAVRLQSLLSDPERSGEDKAVLANEMLVKITRSFSEGISAMSSCDSVGGCEDAVSGDTGESKTRPGSKEGRGCYKRRKGSQLRTTVNSTKEDGYAWRKYGQKEILNSKFPRCYYRCTHKHDQGCKATKQVQNMEDNPNMYQITYIGQHTCREIIRAPQMIPDSDTWEFHNPSTHSECKPQDHCPINPLPRVKDEHKEDSGSDLTECVSGFNQGCPDFPRLGSSSEVTTISSTAEYDVPLWSFTDDGFRSFSDMSFMDRYMNFDGDFQFGGSDLL